MWKIENFVTNLVVFVSFFYHLSLPKKKIVSMTFWPHLVLTVHFEKKPPPRINQMYESSANTTNPGIKIPIKGDMWGSCITSFPKYLNQNQKFKFPEFSLISRILQPQGQYFQPTLRFWDLLKIQIWNLHTLGNDHWFKMES